MIRLLAGDCRDVLATLPAESVQCVVTSPPYYGLRDYGTALWDGGDAACNHREALRTRDQGRDRAASGGTFHDSPNPAQIGAPFRDTCGKCGAVRVDRQIGLEPTPEEYLATMVGVFREVRRVLRRDGTCWVNLGDSMSSGGNGPGSGKQLTNVGANMPPKRTEGLAAKQLLLMPARLALALQADGWWVRSAIVWAKPNPMPESVDSRPTSAYEMVYLLAKGEWKSRVIKFADLPSERVHLLQDFGLRPVISSKAHPPAGRDYHPIVQKCIHLAAAIFDRAQRENEFSLPPFYSEIWQKGDGGSDSDLVRALPIEHRAATFSARFLASQTTAKEFMGELHGCQVALPDGDDFLVGRAASATEPLSPTVYGNRKRTITIHDAGKICEIDFVHSEVILKSPTKCNYYYDADAVRKEAEYGRSQETASWHDVADAASAGLRLKRTSTPGNGGSRNLRNVWTIATHAYPEAHFATYPPELAERCIKAGTSERGCCAACGKPWVRVTEMNPEYTALAATNRGWGKADDPRAARMDAGHPSQLPWKSQTTGWAPGCACHASAPENTATIPCTVLDPFAGAGTTLLVADRLQRDAVGIELNTAYTEMAMERCRADAPLFTSFPPAEDPEEMRMADLFTDMAAD